MQRATPERNVRKVKIALSENNKKIGKRQYTLVKCIDCNLTAKNVFCVYGIPIIQNNIITSIQNHSKPFIACSRCLKRIGARVKVICAICNKENDKPKCECTTNNLISIEDRSSSINAQNNNKSSSENTNSPISYKFKKFSFDDSLYDQNRFDNNISYVPRKYNDEMNYEDDLQQNNFPIVEVENDQQIQEKEFQPTKEETIQNIISHSKRKQLEESFEENNYDRRIFKRNPYLPRRNKADQNEVEEITYIDPQKLIVKFDSIDDICFY